jgi:hypothetical protein
MAALKILSGVVVLKSGEGCVHMDPPGVMDHILLALRRGATGAAAEPSDTHPLPEADDVPPVSCGRWLKILDDDENNDGINAGFAELEPLDRDAGAWLLPTDADLMVVFALSGKMTSSSRRFCLPIRRFSSSTGLSMSSENDGPRFLGGWIGAGGATASNGREIDGCGVLGKAKDAAPGDGDM